MPDRQYLADLIARTKRSWFLLILCVIVLACVSCSDAVSFQRGTVQSPHVTEAGRLPLTDSASPQVDMTPMVPVSTPKSMLVVATPIVQSPSPIIPTAPTSYEAEAPQNTLAGGARVASCSGCSGRERVAYIGLNVGNNTIEFSNLSDPAPDIDRIVA